MPTNAQWNTVSVTDDGIHWARRTFDGVSAGLVLGAGGSRETGGVLRLSDMVISFPVGWTVRKSKGAAPRLSSLPFCSLSPKPAPIPR